MSKAYVSRITESDPRTRRIHIVGETHPGELAERGYVRIGHEWVLEIRRDETARDDAPFVEEFRELSRRGYDFADGDEWSPRDLRDRLLKG